MEEAVKNIELIDKFIENERKSKMWTIISVCGFLVMAAVVVIYSKKLSQTKGKLTLSQDSLQNVNAQLTFLRDSIQTVKDSIYQVNIGLELNTGKNMGKIDSLENVNDTLTVLLNTTQQEIIQNDPQAAPAKINELFQQAFPGTTKTASDHIRESIIKTNSILPKTEGPLLISILYMNQFSGLRDLVSKQLGKEKFTIDKVEPVLGTTFNPVVKYFTEENKKTADYLASRLNKLFGEDLKQPFVSQPVKLKSADRHLEIWIGQYEKPQYLMIRETKFSK